MPSLITNNKLLTIGIPTSAALHALVLSPETVVTGVAMANSMVSQHPITAGITALAALAGGVRYRHTRTLKRERPPVSELQSKKMADLRDKEIKRIMRELIATAKGEKSFLDYGKCLNRLETALLTLSPDKPLPRQSVEDLQLSFDKLAEKIKTKTENIKDPVKQFEAIYRELAKTDYYDYHETQATLPLALDGCNANCESRAKMFYAIVQRIWSSKDSAWQPVVAHYADHLELLLYNTQTKQIYNPYFDNSCRKIPAPLHDPRFFLTGLANAAKEAGYYLPWVNTLVAEYKDDKYPNIVKSPWTNTFSQYGFSRGPVYGRAFSIAKWVNLMIPKPITRMMSVVSPLTNPIFKAVNIVSGYTPITWSLVTASVLSLGLNLFFSSSNGAFAAVNNNFKYDHEKYSDTGLRPVRLVVNRSEVKTIIDSYDKQYTNYWPWDDARRINFALKKQIEYTARFPKPGPYPQVTDFEALDRTINNLDTFLIEFSKIKREMDFFKISPADLDPKTRALWESLNQQWPETNAFKEAFTNFWVGPEGLARLESLSELDKEKLAYTLALFSVADKIYNEFNPEKTNDLSRLPVNRFLSALIKVGTHDQAPKKMAVSSSDPAALFAKNFKFDPKRAIQIQLLSTKTIEPPSPPMIADIKLPLQTITETLAHFKRHPDMFYILNAMLFRNEGVVTEDEVQKALSVSRSIFFNNTIAYNYDSVSAKNEVGEYNQILIQLSMNSRFFPISASTCTEIKQQFEKLRTQYPHLSRVVAVLLKENFKQKIDYIRIRVKKDPYIDLDEVDFLKLVQTDPWIHEIMQTT